MIKRYKFNSKEQADVKLAALYNEENEPLHKMCVVKVGKLIETEGVYEDVEVEVTDDEGITYIEYSTEVVNEPIYREGYHVDILFRDLEESPYGFKTYEVEPKTPNHSFAGNNG